MKPLWFFFVLWLCHTCKVCVSAIIFARVHVDYQLLKKQYELFFFELQSGLFWYHKLEHPCMHCHLASCSFLCFAFVLFCMCETPVLIVVIYSTHCLVHVCNLSSLDFFGTRFDGKLFSILSFLLSLRVLLDGFLWITFRLVIM